jgi:imidazolonepropionase-like amidohydrolase
MRLVIASVLGLFAFLLPVASQTLVLSKSVREFVRVDAPTVALTHVRVVDGTGVAPVEDQNVIIKNGKILAIEEGADFGTAAGTTVVDLRGYTVMPGIVGMHNHLFYIARPNLNSEWKSEPPMLVL